MSSDPFSAFFLSFNQQKEKNAKDARQVALDAEAKRRADVDDRRQASTSALDRAMKLTSAGYVPDQPTPVAGDFQDTFSSGGVTSGGGALGALSKALSNATSAKRLTVPDEGGNAVTYRQDVTSTPEAIQQRRALQAQGAATALDAQKTLEKEQAATTAKQTAYADRVKRITAFAPTMPPERAQAIANDDKLYDAWGAQQFAPKPAKESNFAHVVVTNPDGTQSIKTYDTHTGRSGPDLGTAPVNGGRGAQSIKKAIAANTEQVSVLDDALNELNAYPQAFGLNRGLAELPFMGKFGDQVNQRQDPQGVAARAAVANIGSMIIHDRSGAAVTVSEYPRLAPFVPNVMDTPDAIRTKLKKLKDMIGVETSALQTTPPVTGATTGATGASAVPTYEEWLKKKGGGE